MKDNRTTKNIEPWLLEHLRTSGSTGQTAKATVRLSRNRRVYKNTGTGAGLIDAVVDAINRLTGTHGRLTYCSFNAKLGIKPASYQVTASVKFDGCPAAGRGESACIVEASALAYLDAVNECLANGGNNLEKNRSSI